MATTNCLAGCIGQIATSRPEIGVDAETLAPFVTVRFGADGAVITVGNESAPDFGHEAIIKSFEYGLSNGITCKLEIVDEQGGAFHEFVDRLSKCMKSASKDYRMEVSFGWIGNYCGGHSIVKESPKPLKGTPLDLQVNFAEGKVKYIITSTDLMQAVFASRPSKVIGTDKHPYRLKDAIKELLNSEEPKIEVEYRKFGSDNPNAWEFKDDPKTKWPSDGQNKLATVMKWISAYRTTNDKGVFATWKNVADKPTLILWEDVFPNCDEAASVTSLGTFIVNGGKCSNVLSFNPTINWAGAFAGMTTGGDVGGATTGETVKSEKKCNLQTDDTGISQMAITTEDALNTKGRKEATKDSAVSAAANGRANSMHTPSLRAIEAELRIQGNPDEKFVNIISTKGRTVSIVVINPFHIKGTTGCGDWLAKPMCNPVLSNKFWFIMGINHHIREGSYTTTLNLSLPVPGIDIDANSELGGKGSNGYKPVNNC